MESLLSQLPYAGAIISIVITILGVSAGMYMLDGYRSKKKGEKDSADDRLNGILEKTVRELGGKVDKLERREQELTKEVSELRKDNEKLTAILQGRDTQTQEFYRRSHEAMEHTEANFENIKILIGLIKDLTEGIEKNNEMTSEFVTTIKTHFLNVEKAAITNKE